MAGAMSEHNLLTLDYWQDSVSYEGKTVPSGTIGCEALNISDVLRDDSWNYAEILWNGIQAKTVAAAFDALEHRYQVLLEKRNAICMTFGRVSPLSHQETFEELAVMFEGSGAGRAYRRAVDKLRLKLMESGMIYTVTQKQTERRKKGKKQPPLPTCIRRTTTANGASFGLTLKTAQRRSSGRRSGTR